MKTLLRLEFLAALLCAGLLTTSAGAATRPQVNREPSAPSQSAAVSLAARPPMGWNSFQGFGVYLHEKAALANMAAQAEKLLPYGYKWFVIDNGWFGEYALRSDGFHSAEKHAHDVRLDEYGRFLPSQTYFPNGFEPLVRRCRELGLKFGVHLMRGIPRKAVELNLPIKGTPYRAIDIANRDPAANCTWCQYNYAVDMSKPGAQAWYNSIIEHLADLGVEFVKVDDIVPYPAEVEAIARAIVASGKPMLLSLSPGDKVAPEAIASFRQANMLRVTSDIWDNAAGIEHCFTAWKQWSGAERPGFWIDMDMIPFGQLQLMTPPSGSEEVMGATVALAGLGSRRWSRLSDAQKRTLITLRALAASPLIVGGDLATMDAGSLRLLTEREMIACNQNGIMGTQIHETDGIEVWHTPERGTDGRTGWIGVFNRTPHDAVIPLRPQTLGLADDTALRLEDVWNGAREFTLRKNEERSVTVRANDVLFARFRQFDE